MLEHAANRLPLIVATVVGHRSICVYDDEHDDIAQFFEATNAFIAKVRLRHAGLFAEQECGQACASTTASVTWLAWGYGCLQLRSLLE